jgi:hypothetical protein
MDLHLNMERDAQTLLHWFIRGDEMPSRRAAAKLLLIE